MSKTSILMMICLLAVCLFSPIGCDKEAVQPMDPEPLESVKNIIVTDQGDAGNGSDMRVAFSRVQDEGTVREYRIFVVPEAGAASFDLSVASGISTYLRVNKTGSDLSVALLPGTRTTNGSLITIGVAYRVFVMTISNDPSGFANVLSEPSASITLTLADTAGKVKVTYIANDGVMIEFMGKKVVIDGVNRVGNLSGWVAPSNAALSAVENGTAPFDDIDVIMITHNHSDHYSTSAVLKYLSAHPDSRLIVPTGMRGAFASNASQIIDVSPAKFQREAVVVNDINIDVLHVEHFDQFGNNFSNVESYAYVVNMDDKRFFHAGDLDYLDSQLGVFSLLSDSITAAFIPTFGDLVSAANRDAIVDKVSPEHIICLHFLVSSLNTTLNQINAIYPGATAFTVPFETRFY